MGYDFKKVNWGPDEAKGDLGLEKYFYRVDGFDEILSGDIRYVIGRKGAGKTAIIERVKQISLEDPLSFFSELSLRNFPVNSFHGLQDKGKTDKSKYVAAWEFIILVELAKIIISDNGAGEEEAKRELVEFVGENGFDSQVGFSETVTLLNEHQLKVKASVKWVGVGFDKGQKETQVVTIHYSKVIESLARILSSVSSQSTYRIFFDELDEGFNKDDDRLKNIILALIRAVENIALRLRNSGLSFSPLLVLRSDIHDSLEDNDLNKIDDYTLRLKWSLDPKIRDENSMSLRALVNSRIQASVSELSGYFDAWDAVTVDNDPALPNTVASLWKYISNRTYERPRDIVKFLKYAAQHKKTGLLTYEAVEKSEIKYSDWLYREIKDEIQSHLPVWNEALLVLTNIGKGRLKTEELCEELSKNKSIAKWMENNSKDAIDIVSELFKFGVLGELEDRRWLFSYKDESTPFDGEKDLIVHYGLHRKLRLVKNKKEYLDFEAYN